MARALAEADPNLAVISIRTLDDQVGRTFAPAARGRDACRPVRGDRTCAGRDRPVWRHVILGGAPHQRDRRPHGARRGSPSRCTRLVLGDAFRRVAVGLLLGLPLAVGTGYLLSAQLYNVPYWDPVALSAAALSLAIAALIASVLPAMRAAGACADAGAADELTVHRAHITAEVESGLMYRRVAIFVFVALSILERRADAQVAVLGKGWLLDAAGRITSNQSEVITGRNSIKGTYSGSGSFTPVLLTDPAFVRFAGGQSYTVTLNYRILAQGSSDFEFGFFSRTGSGEGRFVRTGSIRGATGAAGTETLSARLEAYPDYGFSLKIVGTGAISVDDIRITDSAGQLVASENAEGPTLAQGPLNFQITDAFSMFTPGVAPYRVVRPQCGHGRSRRRRLSRDHSHIHRHREEHHAAGADHPRSARTAARGDGRVLSRWPADGETFAAHVLRRYRRRFAKGHPVRRGGLGCAAMGGFRHRHRIQSRRRQVSKRVTAGAGRSEEHALVCTRGWRHRRRRAGGNRPARRADRDWQQRLEHGAASLERKRVRRAAQLDREQCLALAEQPSLPDVDGDVRSRQGRTSGSPGERRREESQRATRFWCRRRLHADRSGDTARRAVGSHARQLQPAAARARRRRRPGRRRRLQQRRPARHLCHRAGGLEVSAWGDRRSQRPRLRRDPHQRRHGLSRHHVPGLSESGLAHVH